MKRTRKIPAPVGRAMVRGLICPQCSGVFDRDKSHHDFTIKRGGIPFCSASCATKFSSNNRTDLHMTEEKFWAKVDKTPGQGPNGDCWIWIGTLANGYGTVGWNERLKDGREKGHHMTHRIAYELLVGEIPAGLYLLHSCDNPPCVNPDHLRPGTQLDNMRDVTERGRWPEGERSYLANHTNAKIKELKLWLLVGYGAEYLSSKFNIRSADVRRISRGLTWKNVVVTEADLNDRPELIAQAEQDKADGKKTLFARPLRPSIGVWNSRKKKSS